MQAQKDVRSVVIHNILMVLDIQLVSTNAEIVTNMVISVACATRRKKHLTRKGLWSQDHPKHINFRLVQFTCNIPYAASQKKVQVKIPAPQHLIINLVYKLKPHTEDTVFEGRIRYLHRHQHKACQGLQVGL